VPGRTRSTLVRHADHTMPSPEYALSWFSQSPTFTCVPAVASMAPKDHSSTLLHTTPLVRRANATHCQLDAGARSTSSHLIHPPASNLWENLAQILKHRSPEAVRLPSTEVCWSLKCCLWSCQAHTRRLCVMKTVS